MDGEVLFFGGEDRNGFLKYVILWIFNYFGKEADFVFEDEKG